MGSAKLGLTVKETGRLTINMFFKLYGHYKNSFAMEMRLFKANMTYEELEAKTMQDEEWF